MACRTVSLASKMKSRTKANPAASRDSELQFRFLTHLSDSWGGSNERLGSNGCSGMTIVGYVERMFSIGSWRRPSGAGP